MMGGVHTPRGEGSAAAELKVPPSSGSFPVTVRPGFESREKQKQGGSDQLICDPNFFFFDFLYFFSVRKLFFDV